MRDRYYENVSEILADYVDAHNRLRDALAVVVRMIPTDEESKKRDSQARYYLTSASRRVDERFEKEVETFFSKTGYPHWVVECSCGSWTVDRYCGCEHMIPSGTTALQMVEAMAEEFNGPTWEVVVHDVTINGNDIFIGPEWAKTQDGNPLECRALMTGIRVNYNREFNGLIIVRSMNVGIGTPYAIERIYDLLYAIVVRKIGDDLFCITSIEGGKIELHAEVETKKFLGMEVTKGNQ